jgi:hypothetical protein
MAAACGRVLDLEHERVAAADELVALTLPEFVALGALAMLTEARPEPCRECMSGLSHNAAGVLRLVDRALAAHGRDNGYSAEPWLEHAFHDACVRAVAVSRLELDDLPVTTLVEAAAQALADVVIALHRDRIGVPEGLADALASLLGLYAAGADREAGQ